MWFFKSFENLLILTFLVSLLLTFMVPEGMFTKHSTTSTFIMILFFMFKSVAAVVLFYGFALGKTLILPYGTVHILMLKYNQHYVS
jgi:hypothetical protein